MWAVIGGIVGASIVHGIIWAVRRWREAREERRRLELFGVLYGVAPMKGESNAQLRARMNDVIRGVASSNRKVPAWLTQMQANGEAWLKKHGDRS